MIRTIFAMAVAGLVFVVVSGTSQATPIAPLPAGATAGTGHVTQVWWWHRGQRCWRGRWGRVHCRW